jgi:hypothetical protein
MTIAYGEVSWERIVSAVEKVQARLKRAVQALGSANIPYAVAGGNAVAAWVSRINEAAVRFTRDVDILLQREDLPRAIAAMESAGFTYRHVAGIDLFLDGPGAKAEDAVHILFGGEKVRKEYTETAPSVTESEVSNDMSILSLEAIRMKLTSFRRKDQMHLIDLINIGHINEEWPSRFSPELAARLQELLDDPNERV